MYYLTNSKYRNYAVVIWGFYNWPSSSRMRKMHLFSSTKRFNPLLEGVQGKNDYFLKRGSCGGQSD